ncbi:MAG: hypothetical protein F6K34_28675, partial [Okeania sp. SIO4D6]|nr:hypothetical protein [Okeania sp. SIO4D6]
MKKGFTETTYFGVGKLGYDINLNYLGVRSQESGVRRKERKKEEERVVEGESFMFGTS